MTGNKKYIIIGFLGAIIIGIASFIFLDNHLDRDKIFVMARDIKKGEVIKEEDICEIEFLSFYLPDDLLLEKKEIIGKTIKINRLKNDFISKGIFIDEKNSSILDNLKENETVIALKEKNREPLLKEICSNSLITIISTKNDIDYMNVIDMESSYTSGYVNNSQNSPDLRSEDTINSDGNLIQGELNLSENKLTKVIDNVFQINNYLLVRNLKILKIERQSDSKKDGILLDQDNEETVIYIRCSLAEAFFISMITREENYKIIFEKV